MSTSKRKPPKPKEKKSPAWVKRDGRLIARRNDALAKHLMKHQLERVKMGDDSLQYEIKHIPTDKIVPGSQLLVESYVSEQTPTLPEIVKICLGRIGESETAVSSAKAEAALDLAAAEVKKVVKSMAYTLSTALLKWGHAFFAVHKRNPTMPELLELVEQAYSEQYIGRLLRTRKYFQDLELDETLPFRHYFRAMELNMKATGAQKMERDELAELVKTVRSSKGIEKAFAPADAPTLAPTDVPPDLASTDSRTAETKTEPPLAVPQQPTVETLSPADSPPVVTLPVKPVEPIGPPREFFTLSLLVSALAPLGDEPWSFTPQIQVDVRDFDINNPPSWVCLAAEAGMNLLANLLPRPAVDPEDTARLEKIAEFESAGQAARDTTTTTETLEQNGESSHAVSACPVDPLMSFVPSGS